MGVYLLIVVLIDCSFDYFSCSPLEKINEVMPDNCYGVWKEGMALRDSHRLPGGYEFSKEK